MKIKAIEFIKLIVLLVVTIYTASQMSIYYHVFIAEKFLGMYNPIFDSYMCKTSFACLHEQGHSHDAHGAPYTIMQWQWRSTNPEFRQTINSIYDCTQAIFATQDILHTQYPKTSITLMEIEYSMKQKLLELEWSEWTLYSEIYANLYAHMKMNRWDEYHYDSVEDMAEHHLDVCQNYLRRTFVESE